VVNVSVTEYKTIGADEGWQPRPFPGLLKIKIENTRASTKY
jgi:hypothetical protein